MAFYAGQKVVYVGRDGYGDPELVLDRVYTVSRYYIAEGEPCLELFEIDSPADEDYYEGFLACVFRPVVEKKTDISIFKKMLLPKSNRRSLETVA